MPSYRVSESIRAKPDAIWTVLANVTCWPDWTPTVSVVEGLDGQCLKMGARFRVLQPKLRPAVWTVTAIDASKRFTWTTRSPGLQLTADHVLAAEDAGTTRLELRFTIAGALSPIVGPLAKRVVIAYMSTEAAKLKARVQALGAVREDGV
jgi:hypothetical protein